jgi:hypothetical protein
MNAMAIISKTITPTSNQTIAPLPFCTGAAGGAGGTGGLGCGATGAGATAGATAGCGGAVGALVGGVALGGAAVGVGVGAGVGVGVVPPGAAVGGDFHCEGGTITVAPRSAAGCLRSAPCVAIGAPHSGQNAFCSGTVAPHLVHFAIHEFSAPFYE